MILSDYIKNYENILDYKVCDEIIENSKKNKFVPATTGDDNKTKARTCYSSKLDKKFESLIYETIGKILLEY